MNSIPTTSYHTDTRLSLLLLVDDKDLGEHICASIEDHEFEVFSAQNSTGIELLIHDSAPDLILLSASVPDINIKNLQHKAHTANPESELIVICGHNLAEEQLGFELRAAEIITTPLSIPLLSAALNRTAERILLRRKLHKYEQQLKYQSERMAILEKTRDKYEHLFNQVPCYITVQDRDMRIVEANDRFLKDFGLERGVLCHQAYKNRNEECENCPVRRTFLDGELHHSETVVSTKHGDQFNILVWTAPVFNEDGRVEHVLEVSTDITMVRQLQDQLTSLGMMLGSMSHGIKGLLGALDGGIYRVDAGLKNQDLERIDKGWKVVKHRIGHMRKMVLDTLYYAKSRNLECRFLNLEEFAEDLAEAVKPKAVEHGIKLVTDFSDSDCIFKADSTALAPALINFLENGIDACLYDRSKSEHTVIFRTFEQDGFINFEITDNGTGMDRETSENMFSLFFSSKGANGTGIGLFISNQVIKQHQGTIAVDSSIGKGTRFHIRIPTSGIKGCCKKENIFIS